MFKKLVQIILLALLLGGAAVVRAEYPERNIRIVVPLAAGGSTDQVARVFALTLADRFGQPVIVENKPGAGGQLGCEAVAFAPADGYTLLFTSSSALTLPYLRKTRFELLRDFAPIGQVGFGNFALVTNRKLPFTSFGDFLAAIKAHPGKYTFGSAGVGGAGHLAGELLKTRAALDIVHVPYKSNGEVSQALMTGEIDFAIDVITAQKPQINAQKVRGLATTGKVRDPNLPDLPTINESMLVPGGYEMTFWFGMFMPAKTPAAVVARVRSEFDAVMKDPNTVARIKTFSLNPSTLTAAQFQANIEAETNTWKKVITQSGLEAKD